MRYVAGLIVVLGLVLGWRILAVVLPAPSPDATRTGRLAAPVASRILVPFVGQWIWTRTDRQIFLDSRTRLPELIPCIWVSTIGFAQGEVVQHLANTPDLVQGVRSSAIILRFEDSFHLAWATNDAATLARNVGTKIEQLLRQVAAVGLTVSELHLDNDCPMRLLKAWAGVVRTLGSGVLAGQEVWVTSLPVHLQEPRYSAWFGGAVAGHILQLFDTGVEAEAAMARQLAERLAQQPLPFRLGLGAFERATANGPTQHQWWFTALRIGDLQAAARQIVEHVLDTPAMLADHTALVRAVEFLELLPSLQGVEVGILRSYFLAEPQVPDAATLPAPLQAALAVRSMPRQQAEAFLQASPHHPRAATLRFVALQEAFAADIPNGWSSDIQARVSPATWRAFEQRAEQWLTDFPQRMLRDLVQLWKVRLYYFEGDATSAWQTLLAVYPRHQARVLGEMRYLLLCEMLIGKLIDRIDDPMLITGLALLVPAHWESWWTLSEQHIAHAWAVNLQERLLLLAAQEATPGHLPVHFPTAPRNPTPLWGKLRALALMRAARWDEARTALFSLQPDPEQALLAAAYHLMHGDPAQAVLVIGLPTDIRHYLLWVLLDEQALNGLLSAKNPEIRQEVQMARAIRLASAGQWREAAQLVQASQPARATLWLQAATLSADQTPSGRLKWARFLMAQDAQLFYGKDTTWYRSLNGRYRDLGERHSSSTSDKAPQGSPFFLTPVQEQDAIARHLTQTTGLWPALKLYAAWLKTAEPSAEMRAVLKEADTCYNALVNWDATNSSFWANYLEHQETVAHIREAGKRAKGKL